MKNKCKVLFFIDTLCGGGAEKVLCNLVNNMNQKIFDISVCTIMPCEYQKYLKNGIKYKSIIRSQNRLFIKIKYLWYRICTQLGLTYQLYLKDDYDVEVAFLECGPTKVISASKNENSYKVAWVHCDVKKKGLSGSKIASYYNCFDKIVCVSEDSKKSFEETFGGHNNVEVLYNVIDEEQIFNKVNAIKIEWELSKTHLITVGRLSYEKGCDRIIKVCSYLKDDGFNFEWHVIGDGPEKDRLIHLVRENELMDYVYFEGYSDNPYPYMNAADVIVVPSRTEALSTVVIESLILGKTIVTTPCSGMRELLSDSRYGIITEDSEESLYYNIRELMMSSKTINNYCVRAKKRGVDFYKRNSLKKIENTLLNKAKREG